MLGVGDHFWNSLLVLEHFYVTRVQAAVYSNVLIEP